jgi:hypothetical protein
MKPRFAGGNTATPSHPTIAQVIDAAPIPSYTSNNPPMDKVARRALTTVHRCVAADRVRLLPHFIHRMDMRGIVWADVLAMLDNPSDILADDADDWGRSRWIITGGAADGGVLGVVCVLGHDAAGALTVFVTAFWEDSP